VASVDALVVMTFVLTIHCRNNRAQAVIASALHGYVRS